MSNENLQDDVSTTGTIFSLLNELKLKNLTMYKEVLHELFSFTMEELYLSTGDEITD